MATPPRLEYLYEQAELAMSDCESVASLSLLWRKGDHAIMEVYYNIPKQLPNADAAVLYVALNNQSGTTLTAADASTENQWMEVYLRLKSAFDERLGMGEDAVAMVTWDPPAPSSRSTIRRKMGF